MLVTERFGSQKRNNGSTGNMKTFIILSSITGAIIVVFGCILLYSVGWDIFALELSHYPIRVTKAYKIPSSNMEPIIAKGDRIFTLKYKEAKLEPQRFDIVVFNLSNDPKSYLKRIVGLPEETLEIKDGKVLINGKPLPGDVYYYNGGDFGKDGDKIHIPANCYYVLGDSSATSKDSRYFGVVSRDNIVANAIRLCWPIHRVKNIKYP